MIALGLADPAATGQPATLPPTHMLDRWSGDATAWMDLWAAARERQTTSTNPEDVLACEPVSSNYDLCVGLAFPGLLARFVSPALLGHTVATLTSMEACVLAVQAVSEEERCERFLSSIREWKLLWAVARGIQVKLPDPGTHPELHTSHAYEEWSAKPYMPEAAAQLATAGFAADQEQVCHSLADFFVDLREIDDALLPMAPAPKRERRDRTVADIVAVVDRLLDTLTPREREITALAIGGFDNNSIADCLYLSRRTVENKLYSAYRKLGVRGRDELAKGCGLGQLLNAD